MYTSAINIKNQNDGIVDKDLSYGLSIILMIICAAKILIVPTVILCLHKRGELDTEKRLKRCGVSFGDLNHEIRGYWALLYPFF